MPDQESADQIAAGFTKLWDQPPLESMELVLQRTYNHEQARLLLFFPEITAIGVSLIVAALTFVWVTCGAIFLRLIPMEIQRDLSSWSQKKSNKMVLSAIAVLIAIFAVWSSWDWAFPYGGILRLLDGI